MKQLFLSDKEIRIIIDTLVETDHKDLVQTILEQVFKTDLTNSEVESIIQ